mmetsp:Transcript_44120/g.104401  ORF Transcript_44120/g.104401 Transcript_44120/m.104401 type:complete len:143 (+) Transcript_44120:67-495(+)
MVSAVGMAAASGCLLLMLRLVLLAPLATHVDGAAPPMMGGAAFGKSIANLNESQIAQIHDQQQKQFAMLDEDSSGSISSEEVLALKEKLRERKKNGQKLNTLETTLLRKVDAKDFHGKLDTDGDGEVTFDEYKFDKEKKYDL